MCEYDLTLIAAASARIFGVLVCLPISDAIQTLPRLFLSICFGAALSQQINQPPFFFWHTPLTEFVVGFILAAPLRIFVEAAEMLGELLDTARGQTIGSVMDPLNGQQVSDMASLLRVGATVLVINLDGFDRAVDAVRSSYAAIPASVFFANNETLLHSIANNGLNLVTSACSLSCVWLLAYLLSDISAAMLARVTQGLSFTNSSSIVKMVLTFLLLGNLLSQPSAVTRLATRVTTTLGISAPAGSSAPLEGIVRE